MAKSCTLCIQLQLPIEHVVWARRATGKCWWMACAAACAARSPCLYASKLAVLHCGPEIIQLVHALLHPKASCPLHIFSLTPHTSCRAAYIALVHIQHLEHAQRERRASAHSTAHPSCQKPEKRHIPQVHQHIRQTHRYLQDTTQWPAICRFSQ